MPDWVMFVGFAALIALAGWTVMRGAGGGGC